MSAKSLTFPDMAIRDFKPGKIMRCEVKEKQAIPLLITFNVPYPKQILLSDTFEIERPQVPKNPRRDSVQRGLYVLFKGKMFALILLLKSLLKLSKSIIECKKVMLKELISICFRQNSLSTLLAIKHFDYIPNLFGL